MMNNQLLDLIPIWAIYVLTVLILFVAIEAGFRLGRLVQKRWPDKSESSVGAMVGAALALLGFLLAFVASLAIGIFNDRRQLVISEANAIGTAYLRAGYLAEPVGAESRQLLREYVNLRLEALDPAKMTAAIARSEQIHDELWMRAEMVARENPGPTVALYVSSVNEIIDLHTERMTAELGFRVPSIVVYGLYGVAVLTMILLGLYNSYRETHNQIAQIIVVLILSAVFLIIVDLDRSYVGVIKIPQDALMDLQEKLNLTP